MLAQPTSIAEVTVFALSAQSSVRTEERPFQQLARGQIRAISLSPKLRVNITAIFGNLHRCVAARSLSK
jgi:hypothetical protein